MLFKGEDLLGRSTQTVRDLLELTVDHRKKQPAAGLIALEVLPLDDTLSGTG
jgi:hypothetical protein